MLILNYFQSKTSIPDPNGPLSRQIPSDTIRSINQEVKERLVHVKSRNINCRGPYQKISPEDKVAIGRYASEHSITSACRHFKGKSLKESTVRDWMKLYRKELKNKSKLAKVGELVRVEAIPAKKHGNPPLLGEKLDVYLQSYLKAMRSRGAPVGSSVVVGVYY